MNQHRVEISTLLRMVMTKKTKNIKHDSKPVRGITMALALEAIGALKDSDQCGSRISMRELEHVIERSVLLSGRDTISVIPSLDQEEMSTEAAPQQFPSLEENERSYILSVLKKTHGRIRGKNGAAAILKIPPTTLHSKMKKHGIRKTMG